MRKKQLRKPVESRTTGTTITSITSTTPTASTASTTPSLLAGPPPPAVPARRRARVRNRLLVSVALCAVAVLAAGAPAVLSASDDVHDSQALVDLAGLNQQSIALSHSLADERDDMVEYIAAGRTSEGGAGVSEAQRARVDRQISEVRASSLAPSELKQQLRALPKTRQQAIAGRGSARDAYDDYTGTIQALHAVSQSVARGLPGRAENATADSLPDLARAVEQASAVRGLLRGALAGTGSQRALASEAQRANVREQAALADFDQTAGTSARDTFDQTVTGTDVTLAERYLTKLTDRPYIDISDRAMNRERIETTLSARIDRMRGVQASFAAHEVKRLEKLRDDDVTALELRIALVGVCLLVAVGISVQAARSMARPLSVLRRGSQRLAGDPAGEEPVEFTGKDDEFADVVRALNELRATAAALQERATEAEADNAYLMGTKDDLTGERDQLRREYEKLKERLDAMSGAAHGTFVNLALRTLGLVERQLGVIEGLEEKETDPDRLGTLFKLDHLATRMRRHSENLLLLAGAEHTGSHHSSPVPLLDVLRAAISEIERYERVELGTLPPHAQLSGFAADDLSHLLAELLDNATSFSAPESEVRLSGWLLENGEIMLSVEDGGIGVAEERLAELNLRLVDPGTQEPPAPDESAEPGGLGMGLYVVARLAARHGLRVQLRRHKQGGVTAVVVVPRALLPDRPAPSAAPSGATRTTTGTATSLPGSVAEANSNALPRRRPAHRRTGEADDASPAAPSAPGAPSAPEEPEAQGATGAPETAGPDAAAAHAHTADADVDADVDADTGVDADADATAPADPLIEAAERSIQRAQAAVARLGEVNEEGVPSAREHTRALGDAAPATTGATAPGTADPAPAEAEAESVGTARPEGEENDAQGPKLTGKGLPKRTPRNVAAQPGPARARKGGANAEELRRRLGGFQQGSQHGRRDAEAEADAEQYVKDQSGAQIDGGTAEEARK
ncbi:sensor histidine kinase [Streptomyces daliensis]